MIPDECGLEEDDYLATEIEVLIDDNGTKILKVKLNPPLYPRLPDAENRWSTALLAPRYVGDTIEDAALKELVVNIAMPHDPNTKHVSSVSFLGIGWLIELTKIE